MRCAERVNSEDYSWETFKGQLSNEETPKGLNFIQGCKIHRENNGSRVCFCKKAQQLSNSAQIRQRKSRLIMFAEFSTRKAIYNFVEICL